MHDLQSFYLEAEVSEMGLNTAFMLYKRNDQGRLFQHILGIFGFDLDRGQPKELVVKSYGFLQVTDVEADVHAGKDGSRHGMKLNRIWDLELTPATPFL